MRVGEISETDLLARIFPRLPRGRTTVVGPGDDAAVLAGSAAPQVVTTDVLVQDRHFRLGWGTGADLGWRAAMQNLADVAAMGAVPTSLVMALVLPGHVRVSWVQDLAEGFAQACAPHQVGVVGGDLTSGDQITIAVTALGVIDDGEPVLRSGARPGDVVAVSGVLGHARAGLALLEAGRTEPAELVGAFLRPSPPLRAGPAAARAGAHALMDISDGLARDAGRIAVASGVQVDLDPAALATDIAALVPVAEQVGADATAWVLGGGEDHGALATFPPVAAGRRAHSHAPPVRTTPVHPRAQGGPPSSALPEQFRPIGRVRTVPPGGAPGVRWGGADLPPGTEGWDHFGR